MEAGDNPLDVNYDIDTEQLRDEMIEKPEKRRDSDGSELKIGGAGRSSLGCGNGSRRMGARLQARFGSL